MENLVKNFLKKMESKRKKEFDNSQIFKDYDDKSLFLITSGKVMALDSVIVDLKRLLKFEIENGD